MHTYIFKLVHQEHVSQIKTVQVRNSFVHSERQKNQPSDKIVPSLAYNTKESLVKSP